MPWWALWEPPSSEAPPGLSRDPHVLVYRRLHTAWVCTHTCKHTRMHTTHRCTHSDTHTRRSSWALSSVTSHTPSSVQRLLVSPRTDHASLSATFCPDTRRKVSAPERSPVTNLTLPSEASAPGGRNFSLVPDLPEGIRSCAHPGPTP